jgi:hypothetical protein
MLTAQFLLNASPSDIVTFGNNRHLVGLSILGDLRDLSKWVFVAYRVQHETSTTSPSSTNIMYLGISNVLRGLFTFRSGDKKGEATDSQSDDHSYIRGNIVDRGPCPGLNALANQGYLCVSAALPL